LGTHHGDPRATRDEDGDVVGLEVGAGGGAGSSTGWARRLAREGGTRRGAAPEGQS